MTETDELLKNILVLKEMLSPTGPYSICRSDHELMNIGDQLIVGSILERIDEGLKKAPVELQIIQDALQDLLKNGTRHDLNPTICIDGANGPMEYQTKLVTFFYDYLRGMDGYVRQVAQNTLGKVQEVGEYMLIKREDVMELRDLARTGLPIDGYDEERWAKHRLNKIAGELTFILEKEK